MTEQPKPEKTEDVRGVQRWAPLVVILFTLNAGILVWHVLLPQENDTLTSTLEELAGNDFEPTLEGPIMFEEKLKQGVRTEALRTGVSPYRSLYRQHALANRITAIVMFLDTVLLFVLGLHLCARRLSQPEPNQADQA